MSVLFGIVLIVSGLLYLFAGDLMWSLQRFRNDLDGQLSHRGEWWEIKRVFFGTGFLIAGVILVLVGT